MFNSSKILQIIPAPSDMWVQNRDGDEYYYTRVVCLALVEWPDGDRTVEIMDISDGDGAILQADCPCIMWKKTATEFSFENRAPVMRAFVERPEGKKK